MHRNAKTNLSYAVLTILALLQICAPAALAEGFPGKGDEDAWSDALPYYNRGNRYLQKEQFQQALEDFKVAVGKYTYDPDFYLNLGVAYRKVGDYTNAEDAYKKSLQLNDKDWMPWNDLANVYLKQNKLKETVATFQRLLKCNPPAKDKAAIQQDIIDINKILKMQAPPPRVANRSDSSPSAKGPQSKSARPDSKKATNINGEKKNAENAKTAGTKAPSEHVSGTNPTSDKKALKNSGWDYVYGGKSSN